MGLFKNAAAEWEKTMTENDLDKMEAAGTGCKRIPCKTRCTQGAGSGTS